MTDRTHPDSGRIITSGAAIQRYKIGYHADEWGQRSSTPSGIPDASGSWVRYADHVTALAAGQATAQQASTVTNYTTLGAAMRAIRQSIQMIGDPEDECMRAVKRVLRGAVIIVEDSGDEVAAPAAPAQPAAQQGVAYAALPEKYYLAGGEVPTWDAKQMHAFADATCALRASHGQAPAAVPDDFLSHKLAWREAIAQCGLAVSADDPDRSYWEHELRAFDRAYSELASITPQADSVQEDAALWHWLAEYLVGTRTDLDDEIVASETVNDLRKLVKAAIKQGEKQ